MDARHFAAVISLVGVALSAPAAFPEDEVPKPALPEAASKSGEVGSGLNPNVKLDDLVKQDILVPSISTVVNTITREAHCPELDFPPRQPVGFKHVNDEFGHTAGDVVLKILARQLQKQCRTSDSICRYGGEEFCVVLPHTDERGAASWAELARQTISAMPVTICDRSIRVTASFGVAARLADDDRIEFLIDRADQALMAAKRAGRDRVVRSTAVSARKIAEAVANEHPPARPTRAQLIFGAQAIARAAAELSEIISSEVDDPVPSATERISKLKELVRSLLTNLQRPNLPALVNLDNSIQASTLNVSSNTGNSELAR